MCIKRACFCCAILLFAGSSLPGQVVDTAFTYNGQLARGSEAIDGQCTLTFTLWDAATDGQQIGSAQALENVAVDDGLFSVKLDFGSGAFAGERRWIQVDVQCPGDKAALTVSPRQELSASPSAVLTRDATDQIPRGVIAMWSGSIAEIPAGWALCDGANGTPDLRDRFVYGVSADEDPGAIGGESGHVHAIASHSHSADPPPTAAQAGGDHAHSLFPHQHNVDYAATNTASAGDHGHTVDFPNTNSASGGTHSHTVDPGATNTGSSGSHNHGGASTSTGGSFGRVLAGQNDGVVTTHAHGIGSSGSHAHSIDIGSASSGTSGTHGHTLDLSAFSSAGASGHAHAIDPPVVAASFSGFGATEDSATHQHNIDLSATDTSATAPDTERTDHLPEYYELAFIMRQ